MAGRVWIPVECELPRKSKVDRLRLLCVFLSQQKNKDEKVKLCYSFSELLGMGINVSPNLPHLQSFKNSEDNISEDAKKIKDHQASNFTCSPLTRRTSVREQERARGNFDSEPVITLL